MKTILLAPGKISLMVFSRVPEPCKAPTRQNMFYYEISISRVPTVHRTHRGFAVFGVGKEFQMKLMIDETFISIHFESQYISRLSGLLWSLPWDTRKLMRLLCMYFMLLVESFQHGVGPCRTQKHPKVSFPLGPWVGAFFCENRKR